MFNQEIYLSSAIKPLEEAIIAEIGHMENLGLTNEDKNFYIVEKKLIKLAVNGVIYENKKIYNPYEDLRCEINLEEILKKYYKGVPYKKDIEEYFSLLPDFDLNIRNVIDQPNLVQETHGYCQMVVINVSRGHEELNSNWLRLNYEKGLVIKLEKETIENKIPLSTSGIKIPTQYKI